MKYIKLDNEFIGVKEEFFAKLPKNSMQKLFDASDAGVTAYLAEQAKQVSANTENSKFRESALAKLSKLGLTKQEVKALFG